jgi:pantothenate kinase
MKKILTGILLLVTANAVQANSVPGVPSFMVECPAKVLVQADQDGPVMINNKEAETKAINDRRFEAKGSGVTLSIMLADDDSVTVSSTGKAPNGVCQSVDD